MSTATQSSLAHILDSDDRDKLITINRGYLQEAADSPIWNSLFVDDDGRQAPMSWGDDLVALHIAQGSLAHIDTSDGLSHVLRTYDCRPIMGRYSLVLHDLGLNPPLGLEHDPEAYTIAVSAVMARMYERRHGIALV